MREYGLCGPECFSIQNHKPLRLSQSPLEGFLAAWVMAKSTEDVAETNQEPTQLPNTSKKLHLAE